MNQEQSTMEPANTIGSSVEQTPKENEKPSASTAGREGTLTRTPTKSETVESPRDTNAGVVEDDASYEKTPPSVLVELGRQPEICNLLEMGESYEHFNMKVLTNEIDSFINEQIIRDGLKDNKESYKKVFEDLLEKSDPPRNDIYSMIERIKSYVDIQNKLIRIAKEKEEFERKPLEEMTSSELRKVIYGTTNS